MSLGPEPVTSNASLGVGWGLEFSRQNDDLLRKNWASAFDKVEIVGGVNAVVSIALCSPPPTRLLPFVLSKGKHFSGT